MRGSCINDRVTHVHVQLMKSVRQSKEKMYAEMSRALKSQREEV